MRHLGFSTYFVLILLFCASPILAETAGIQEAKSRDGMMRQLGSTEFPTTAGEEAKAHFMKGLLALHSFEYEDARDAFRAAREVEPDYAMAAWGEAMTRNHPLWNEENREAAVEALEELAPTREERLAKAPTPREKAYLEAVEILFGEGEKLERDLAYSAAMGKVAERWPEDLDAASFYALSLLGTCHDGRDIPTYMRAAAVVEEVFARNPQHPGAAHYLIHSYDDPVHAPLGLRAARVYAEIAPAAEHALHMPSHVFLALGMWQETAASNVDSYEAGEARRQRKDQGVGRRGYHALQWLHYARLQLGQTEEALEILRLVAQDDEETDARRTRSHLAVMRAAHAVDGGDWERLPTAPDFDDLSPSQVGASLFADGLAAVARGNLAGARAVLADMRQRYGSKGGEEIEACHASTGGYSRFGEVDLEPVQIMELELEALVRHREGRSEEAVSLLRQATEIEAERSFGFGPPMPSKPSHELLGEILLDLDRPAEAMEEFEKALERSPRRRLSLAGLERAAKALGDQATVVRVSEELRSMEATAP